MKLREFGLFIVAGIVAIAFVVGYISKNYFGDDNVIEEVAEAVIEEETGMDIDLSPGSAEKK